MTQEVVRNWQKAASNILVAVGNKHINEIMEEILSKFQPGVLPHFFVVQTLANLSDSNGKKTFTADKLKEGNLLLYLQQGKDHKGHIPNIFTSMTGKLKQ